MPSKEYTLQEETEPHKIEKGLAYQKTLWSETPMNCHTIKIAASAILRSTKRRLTKNPKHADTYCSQIWDMFQRDVSWKPPRNKVDSYKRPVFYLSLYEVLKPDSESKPITYKA